MKLLAGISLGTPATNKVKNEHDERDHEQEMNEAAGNMKSKPAAPKEEKYNGDNK